MNSRSSIKTVNHRGLDLHFHMPLEFDAVEPALRAAVRKRIVRGHVQVQVSFKRNAEPVRRSRPSSTSRCCAPGSIPSAMWPRDSGSIRSPT